MLSLSPLHNGKNDLEINVVRAPNSKVTIQSLWFRRLLNNLTLNATSFWENGLSFHVSMFKCKPT